MRKGCASGKSSGSVVRCMQASFPEVSWNRSRPKSAVPQVLRRQGIQLRAKRRLHLPFAVVGQEAEAYPVEQHLVDLREAEGERLGQQRDLIAERGIEERRIVRVDGDRHARVVKRPEGMMGEVGIDAQA